MKNYNKILEAVDRGVRLALDDYEDIEGNKSISSERDIIQNKEYVKEIILREKAEKTFNDILEKWDTGKYAFTKKDLKTLADISNKYGFKYRNLENNVFLINDTISSISSINPKADLNWIDVSHITNLNEAFAHDAARKFNGDISKWDVSRVKTMEGTFLNSKFNGDISNWNVSNVEKMDHMFRNSKFNGNISNWNVSKVTTMYQMFKDTKFNQDISNWRILLKCTIEDMFCNCEIKPEYKPLKNFIV